MALGKEPTHEPCGVALGDTIPAERGDTESERVSPALNYEVD